MIRKKYASFFCILLSLFMIIGFMVPARPVQAEAYGIEITAGSGNKSGTGWYYSDEYNHLTLNGYNGGGIKIANAGDRNVSISFVGSNTIKVGSVQQDNTAYGIYSDAGELSVYGQEGASLTINMDCNGVPSSGNVIGIASVGGLFLDEGGQITIVIRTGANYNGILTGSSLYERANLNIDIYGSDHWGNAIYVRNGYAQFIGSDPADHNKLTISYLGSSNLINNSIQLGALDYGEMFFRNYDLVINGTTGNYADLTGIYYRENNNAQYGIYIDNSVIEIFGVKYGFYINMFDSEGNDDIQILNASDVFVNASENAFYLNNAGMQVRDSDMSIFSGKACVKVNSNTDAHLNIEGITTARFESKRSYAVDIHHLGPETESASIISLDEGGSVNFLVTESIAPDVQQYVVSEFFHISPRNRLTKGQWDYSLTNAYGASAIQADNKQIIIEYNDDIKYINRVNIESLVKPEYGAVIDPTSSVKATMEPAVDPSEYGAYAFCTDTTTMYGYNLEKLPAGLINYTVTVYLNEGEYIFSPNAEVYLDGEKVSAEIYNNNINLKKQINIVKPNNAPPVITTNSIPEAVINQNYSYQLAAQGDGKIEWSVVGSLPSGLSLSKDGVLSGKVTSSMSTSITVKAKNSYGEDTKNLYFSAGNFTLVERINFNSADFEEPVVGKECYTPSYSMLITPSSVSSSDVMVYNFNYMHKRGDSFFSYSEGEQYKAGLNRFMVDMSIMNNVRFSPNLEVYLNGKKMNLDFPSNTFCIAYFDFDLKGEVTRISGTNRTKTSIETARFITQEKGDKLHGAIIATGEDFADALTGAYLSAAENNIPILLNRRTADVPLIKNFIRNNVNKYSTIFILGGEKAIPSSVFSDLAPDYNLRRVAGNNRFQTNIEILKAGQFLAGDILVCKADEYADALSASSTRMPILLVRGDTLRAEQINYLKTFHGKLRFHIVGGPSAVSTAVESELKKYGVVQERIAGKNRYETSVLVAKKYSLFADTAILATGEEFADGLSGGPLGMVLNSPVLLVNQKRRDVIRRFLAEEGIRSGYVLGGENAVPADLAAYIFGLSSAADIIVFK